MRCLGFVICILAGAASRARNLWFRALGVRIEGYAWLRRISIPRNWGDVWLEPGVALDDGVVLLCSGKPAPGKLRIGAGTYINRHCILDASDRIEIGAQGMIGPHCFITDHDHAHDPGSPLSKQPLISKPTRLGRNVWVGAGAIILKGVTIGDNAVIAAGAVVTKDVPRETIVVGVPARTVHTSA